MAVQPWLYSTGSFAEEYTTKDDYQSEGDVKPWSSKAMLFRNLPAEQVSLLAVVFFLIQLKIGGL